MTGGTVASLARQVRGIAAGSVFGLAFTLVLLAPSFAGTVATGAAIPAAAVTLELRTAVSGFNGPVALANAGDGSGRLFVVEQDGRIRVAKNGRIESTFLDITSIVDSSDYELGLLGLAFHPDYASNGRFFVYYTSNNQKDTLAEYRVSASDPNRANPQAVAILLAVDDPYTNHNGGQLAFGPDGFLYVALGDGGSGGDPHNNGQNLRSLLAKVLRLDVDVAPTQQPPPYEIPSNNPFVGRTDARPEIWAYGLRNPWRLSFDRANGDLYIADVGQNQFEEINYLPGGSAGGQNYGWNRMEGLHCYDRSTCNQTGLTLPIHEYSHNLGCSVTGGYVYRGPAIPSLQGAYVFGDFCSGLIWKLVRNGGVWTRTQLFDLDASISSFGEDEAGELYLADLNTGSVLVLSDASAPTPTPDTSVPNTPTPSPSPSPSPTPDRTPRSDLQITALQVSSGASNRPLPLQVKVKNAGKVGTGGPFDVHFFADLPGPPAPDHRLLIGHLEVPALAAGKSATVNGTLFPDALTTGQHTIWALADGHDVVQESAEGNNARSRTINVTEPAPPLTCADGLFAADYFNGTTPEGAPTFSRCDKVVDESYGNKGPGQNLPADRFSVRWSGRFSFSGGAVTFTTRADDGVRVWLDDVLIVDQWLGPPETTVRTTRAVGPGWHVVKVEYYEDFGRASVSVRW
jgi:glucose/arabinose dehydrogenase